MGGWRGLGRGGVLVGFLGLLTHCGGGEDAESAAGRAAAAPAPGAAEQALSTLTFAAAADLSVRPDVATSGSARTLEAGSAPPRRSAYLRFNVAGLSGAVTRATLRLWVLQGGGNPPKVGRTTSRWSEGNVTWGNRPALGGTVGVSSAGAERHAGWRWTSRRGARQRRGEPRPVLGRLARSSSPRARRGAALRPQLVVEQAELPPASCLPRADQYTADGPPYRDGYGAQAQPTTCFEAALAPGRGREPAHGVAPAVLHLRRGRARGERAAAAARHGRQRGRSAGVRGRRVAPCSSSPGTPAPGCWARRSRTWAP